MSKKTRAVRRRINELDRLINCSRMVYVKWFQELAYLRETGELDWVDPNPIRIHPAGSRMQAPLPRPRS